MKAIGIFLLLLVWHTSFSQVNESFDDGDITSNPPWSGTTADFSLINGSLRLSAEPVSGVSYLATSSESIDSATWKISLKMEFNPSSSNYSEVYLVSNSSELTGALNGYLLRVGWTSDNISLIRQDGLAKTVLINGIEKRLDANIVELALRVSRTKGGEWNLYSMLDSEQDWIFEGSANDLTYEQSNFFGLKCTHTSTRSNKFQFDDIIVTGSPFIDSSAPIIDSVYSTGEKELVVYMSEEVDPATVITKNFSVNNSVPLKAFVDDRLIKLELESAFEIMNSIDISGLTDIAGNMMEKADYNFIHYSFEPVRFGDIVFNEILADPSPPEDLPEVEYIEIINSSNRAILMTNWSLSDRTSIVKLPLIKLLPDSILLLYNESAAADWSIDNHLGLSRWPSLNNSGDEIQLADSSGTRIDVLSYEMSTYTDEPKSEGGWALERIDPYLPCTGQINWRFSENPLGGTPGLMNSVFERIEDRQAPLISQSFVHSEDSVSIYFSEPLVLKPEQVIIDDISVIDYFLEDHNSDRLFVRTSNLEHSKEYLFEVGGIEDCSANRTESDQATLVLPEIAEASDIIINEILFNPIEDFNDYLELYNQSAKFINLRGMILTNGNSEREITNHNIIPPGGYRVFSEEPEEIINSYPYAPIENVLEQNLPTFTNERGGAVIKNNSGLTIDSIRYDELWHFAYLNDVEGIALERISPFHSGLSKSNWASASSEGNYGTPGYENAQATTPEAQNIISIEPKVIVPNADGRDDFTIISINCQDNALLTIRIYNLHGMEIRMLANNEPISGKSSFTWDGTGTHGQLVPLGHYIIVSDLVMEDGRTATYREKMVVGTGY